MAGTTRKRKNQESNGEGGVPKNSRRQVAQKSDTESEDEVEIQKNNDEPTESNAELEDQDKLEDQGTEETERRRSQEFLKKYDSTNQKRQLNEVERMPLEMWHSQLFQSCKYITDTMLVDETDSKSIMSIAFEKMKLFSEEQRKQKREAIKRYLKMKIGKARDFFQQGVRRAVMDLSK